MGATPTSIAKLHFPEVIFFLERGSRKQSCTAGLDRIKGLHYVALQKRVNPPETSEGLTQSTVY